MIVHHWAGYPKRKVKEKVDTHKIKNNLTWDDIHKCFSKKFGTTDYQIDAETKNKTTLIALGKRRRQ
jgi:hypothetical protein